MSSVCETICLCGTATASPTLSRSHFTVSFSGKSRPKAAITLSFLQTSLSAIFITPVVKTSPLKSPSMRFSTCTSPCPA